MCREGVIISGVVCYYLTTSDIWLKTLLKALVYRGGGLNRSGYRGVEVGTKSNSFCGGFVGRVGM